MPSPIWPLRAIADRMNCCGTLTDEAHRKARRGQGNLALVKEELVEVPGGPVVNVGDDDREELTAVDTSGVAARSDDKHVDQALGPCPGEEPSPPPGGHPTETLLSKRVIDFQPTNI